MKMPKEKLIKEIIEWTLTIVIPVALALLIHTYLFTFARVDGTSMLDNFQSNNIMGVSRLYYRYNEPQRGEVITCYYDPPTGSLFKTRKLMVKRIIGLPGETVEVKAGEVYIDGQALTETYLTRFDDRDFGPYTVGEDEILVMGDNRPVSYDGRYIGPIPKDYIYGRVIFVALPLNQIRSTMDVPEYNLS